jgi:hypothetical protein
VDKDKGSVHLGVLRDRSLFMLGGGGGGTEDNFFLTSNFADPTIKKSKKHFLPNLKYQLKNKYIPALGKNFTKRYHSVVTHILYSAV